MRMTFRTPMSTREPDADPQADLVVIRRTVAFKHPILPNTKTEVSKRCTGAQLRGPVDSRSERSGPTRAEQPGGQVGGKARPDRGDLAARGSSTARSTPAASRPAAIASRKGIQSRRELAICPVAHAGVRSTAVARPTPLVCAAREGCLRRAYQGPRLRMADERRTSEWRFLHPRPSGACRPWPSAFKAQRSIRLYHPAAISSTRARADRSA